MLHWLQTRGRGILSFLSDLGGALVFVVLAAGLLAAAVTGAVLVTLDAFPQPFLALFVLGMASLAAGLALHFLRSHLTSIPASAQPLPQTDPRIDNPYSEGATLQRRCDEAKAQEEERNRVLAERRAFRWVREELLDNEHRIRRARGGDPEELEHLTDQHWRECEATLLEFEDPEPHAKARKAYREIGGVETAETLNYNDTQQALAAIDRAVTLLSEAESSSQSKSI